MDFAPWLQPGDCEEHKKQALAVKVLNAKASSKTGSVSNHRVLQKNPNGGSAGVKKELQDLESLSNLQGQNN